MANDFPNNPSLFSHSRVSLQSVNWPETCANSPASDSQVLGTILLLLPEINNTCLFCTHTEEVSFLGHQWALQSLLGHWWAIQSLPHLSVAQPPLGPNVSALQQPITISPMIGDPGSHRRVFTLFCLWDRVFQAGFKCAILLPQPSKCLHWKHVSPYPAEPQIFTIASVSSGTSAIFLRSSHQLGDHLWSTLWSTKDIPTCPFNPGVCISASARHLTQQLTLSGRHSNIFHFLLSCPHNSVDLFSCYR